MKPYYLLAVVLVLLACKPAVPTMPTETTPEIHENLTVPVAPEPEVVHKSAPGISMNGSIGAVDVPALAQGQRILYNESLQLGTQRQQRLVEYSVVSETYNNTECIGWQRANLELENKTFDLKRIWCGGYEFDFAWNDVWVLKQTATTTADFTDKNVRTKNAEDIVNITVPAGTFETLRAAVRTGDRVSLDWYSPNVPITGVVKLQEDRNNYHRTFELVRVS